MNRLRLLDFRASDAAASVGVCQGDVGSLARLVNKAQRRLVFAREAGDAGWWGSWAEMAFTVSQDAPYITTPRDVARLENIAVCRQPVVIQNQFYEYLDFGIGPQPRPACPRPPCGQYLEAYTRNNAVTFTDLTPPNKKVRVRLTSALDEGKRVMISGLDNNGTIITELDNGVNCSGTFVAPVAPFTDTEMEISKITGIQKDVTLGQVKFYSVDADTGDEVLLHTMEPSEKVASYRRYFLNGLPKNCCDPQNSSTTVQVTALAKLELIDVVSDTDYLLIQNLEALAEESASIRYSQIDNTESKKMAQEKHLQAIRLLQGELVHYLGKNRPAVAFKPFGSARLERVAVGMI